MLEQVLKGQRLLKLTHSIITVDGINFENRTLSLTGEYHIRHSTAEPPASPSGAPLPGQKALGVSFLLPEGLVDIPSVSLNGQSVKPVSPLEDLENINNFSSPTFWSFPESADSEAMAAIFARVAENRRDLISYEEILKAHRTASSAQSFGLLVKIPSFQTESLTITIIVKMVLKNSILFKQFSGHADLPFLATLGSNELWFPTPSRLMLLPAGSPVTAQPMEHQRQKITIRVEKTLIPHGMECVASGDRLPSSDNVLVFESSWLNPRSVGLFIGQCGPVIEEKSVFHALALEQDFQNLTSTLRNEIVSEIVQVLAPWFASPVQLLPQLNLVFLPLPVPKTYHVFGNTLLIDSGILHGDRPHERPVLAEAIALLWVERAMPAFAEPWLPAGIAAMLADRFVEFNLGTNEFLYRVMTRRNKYHYLVERGQDWRPLTVIPDSTDPVLQLKAPLVMECLRRSITGDSDLRTAFHEMATIASGKKGPWTSEMFLFLITCTVGQHTEAGKSIPMFKENWIKSVGVPVLHVGFSMLEKRRFAINVSQRPLQKYSCHDYTPLCSANNQTGRNSCSCGQDFVTRSSENSGISFMRPHHVWPTTLKRRFWSGSCLVQIFRASSYYVPVTVSMELDAPENSSGIVTVPAVTPRKHEMHLNRAHREDELVHGFLAFTDDRWLLAKIIVCQSPLMWCNQLAFSRNVMLEHAAIEALEHIRGSTLVQEALANALISNDSNPYFWRTRLEAGRGLVHMAVGCAEREALQTVLNWMSSVVTAKKVHAIEPSDALTWTGVGEYLAVLKRNTDRRDHTAVHTTFLKAMKSIETGIASHPGVRDWRVDPFPLLASAIKFVLLTIGSENDQTVLRSIEARLRSDRYGEPLASPDLVVTENVLAASLGNSAVVPNMFPILQDPKFLEPLASSPFRRVARAAVRTTMNSVGKSESEEGWLERMVWLEHLTKLAINNKGDMQKCVWIVDAWEALAERARKELAGKSAFTNLVQRKFVCDKLWKYLTHESWLLPVAVRPAVQNSAHLLYLQAYGTSLPNPYRESSALAFWMPSKDHERAYIRFIYRGECVKAEIPKSQIVKKPKLLITSAGSVPLAQ